MYKFLELFGLHGEVPKKLKLVLAFLPFVLLISIYLAASHYRQELNPNDKLLPPVSKMYESVKRVAFNEDDRTGEYLLLNDTKSSLKRIGIGVGLAALLGLLVGMNLGMLPFFRATFMPVITFLSIIPPLAILPILFITVGVDELGKVSLIFIGTFFVITRDMYLTTGEIPKEQVIKALTLGASQFEVVYKVVLPQILPRLIDIVRLTMGAAWLFLIASEAIASTDGLGYRIFLVRRYLAMDVIIPYVLWITFLGFIMDWGLRQLVKWRYPWYVATKD